MTNKLAICTPVYGAADVARVSLRYTQALLAFCKDQALVPITIHGDTDLVRSRSRMLRLAMATDCTHVLWWDEDVSAPAAQLAACLTGMLETGHDFVAAPYPRKRLHWDWAAQAAIAGRDAQASAVDYPMDGGEPAKGVTFTVKHVGLGFVLMSRALVETMFDHYAGTDLRFVDVVDDQEVDTVALFQLMIKNKRLLSEDYSFCERAIAIGYTPHVYIGPGSPLDHLGSHLFKGGVR